MGWLGSELVARFEPPQSARGLSAVLDLQTKNVPLARFLYVFLRTYAHPPGARFLQNHQVMSLTSYRAASLATSI
jgi:hypothetical protein